MESLPEILKNKINQEIEKIPEEIDFKLIVNQLEKDFNLCGIHFSVQDNCHPSDFLQQLFYTVYDLVQYRFDGFLQLMYRIDIQQKWNDSHVVLTSEEVAINAVEDIVKRTIQKIKWRKAYENHNL